MSNEHNPDTPFSSEGYALMGAAFEVHHVLGGGLLEEIYQEALQMELSSRELPFVAKQELTAFYKNQRLKKTYIPDLVVYDQIIVELKAVKELITEHEAQLFNYLRLAHKPVGYLINFGPNSKVEWKRFVLSEFVKP